MNNVGSVNEILLLFCGEVVAANQGAILFPEIALPTLDCIKLV